MEGPIALPGRTSPLHLLIRLPFPVFFCKMSLLCVCHHFPQYDTGLLSSGPERTVLGWCNKVDIFMGDHVKNKLKEDSRLFIEGFFSAVFFFFVLSCLVSIYSRSSCTFLKSWMLLEVIPQPPPVSDIFCMSQLIPLFHVYIYILFKALSSEMIFPSPQCRIVLWEWATFHFITWINAGVGLQQRSHQKKVTFFYTWFYNNEDT